MRNAELVRNAQCGMRNPEMPSVFRIPHSIPHSAFRIPHSLRIPHSALRIYWTLAATDPLAASVKVQLFRLLPALEQAPDQTASRPFETVSVTEAPTVNAADPLLPTATLNPAGADVTRSPLRPLTLSVSVAV